MDTQIYESLRHFADSWGMVYMMAIFIGVLALVLRPGARSRAEAAARIPLEDDHPIAKADK